MYMSMGEGIEPSHAQTHHTTQRYNFALAMHVIFYGVGVYYAIKFLLIM
jgi:hypothetical protein